MSNPAQDGINAARRDAAGDFACLQCRNRFVRFSERELFCDKDCYQAHEDRQWVYSEDGKFRVAEPEEFTDQNGGMVKMRLCEELVGGRWEPFYSVVGAGVRLEGDDNAER